MKELTVKQASRKFNLNFKKLATLAFYISMHVRNCEITEEDEDYFKRILNI